MLIFKILAVIALVPACAWTGVWLGKWLCNPPDKPGKRRAF